MAIYAPYPKGLRKWFRYEMETGNLYHYNELVGKRTNSNHGLITSYRGRTYLVAHIAWFLVTGRLPSPDKRIGHKNGVIHDNRWENLHEIDRNMDQFDEIKAASKYYLGWKYIYVRSDFKKQVRISLPDYEYRSRFRRDLDKTFKDRDRILGMLARAKRATTFLQSKKHEPRRYGHD